LVLKEKNLENNTIKSLTCIDSFHQQTLLWPIGGTICVSGLCLLIAQIINSWGLITISILLAIILIPFWSILATSSRAEFTSNGLDLTKTRCFCGKVTKIELPLDELTKAKLEVQDKKSRVLLETKRGEIPISLFLDESIPQWKTLWVKVINQFLIERNILVLDIEAVQHEKPIETSDPL